MSQKFCVEDTDVTDFSSMSMDQITDYCHQKLEGVKEDLQRIELQ